MKFFDRIKDDALSMAHEKQRKKNNEWNKTLYDSAIIQGIYDRINELEKRLEECERR